MRKFSFVLMMLMVLFFLSSCLTAQRRHEIMQLTPVQKAELAIKEGKKVEGYYEDVVILFKTAYDNYRANPTEENKAKLKKMSRIHDKANKMYNSYVQVHNELLKLLEIYKTGDEKQLITLTDALTELARQATINSIK